MVGGSRAVRGPSARWRWTASTADATRSAIASPVQFADNSRQLAADPAGGDTAFLPVAQSAGEVFADGLDDALRLFILITDGASTRDDTAAAIQQLKQVADRVVVVALAQGGQWEHASESWENAGLAVITLDNRRPNEIGATLAKTVIDRPGQRVR